MNFKNQKIKIMKSKEPAPVVSCLIDSEAVNKERSQNISASSYEISSPRLSKSSSDIKRPDIKANRFIRNA